VSSAARSTRSSASSGYQPGPLLAASRPRRELADPAGGSAEHRSELGAYTGGDVRNEQAVGVEETCPAIHAKAQTEDGEAPFVE
jgi:hypothetical protein